MEGETQLEDDPHERRAIELAKSGDAGAYDYLVTKYARRVLTIARGLVRNTQDAEDLAQEAFVKAFESIGRFRSGEPFGPWIYRIVTNLSLDVLKHRARVREEEVTAAAPAARRDMPDLEARSHELAARINQALQSLPPMQQVVARLYLLEELAHAEIAALLHLSEGTVRSHLSLARARLREQLADIYGGSDD